jgi:hypothetical protein
MTTEYHQPSSLHTLPSSLCWKKLAEYYSVWRVGRASFVVKDKDGPREVRRASLFVRGCLPSGQGRSCQGGSWRVTGSGRSHCEVRRTSQGSSTKTYARPSSHNPVIRKEKKRSIQRVLPSWSSSYGNAAQNDREGYYPSRRC